MKKLVILIAAIALLASACKKQDMNLESVKTPRDNARTVRNHNSNHAARAGLSVQYGMLSFGSFSDYIDTFEGITDTEEEAWIEESNDIEFNSLLNNETTNESLYEKAGDDLFRSILNDKGCLKISNYIIKYSPDDSLMYILTEPIYGATPEDLDNLYNRELSEASITAITSKESLIDILQEYETDKNASLFTGSLKDWWANYYNDPTNPNVAGRCSEGGAKGESINGCTEVTVPENSDDECDICEELTYIRGGVYYSLVAHFRIFNENLTRRLELHKTPTHYKIKCGGWYGPMYSWNNVLGKDDTGGHNGTTYKYRPYQSVLHPLHAYHFRCVSMAKFIADPSKPDPSVDKTIRDNL